jgi:hypothetical protein
LEYLPAWEQSVALQRLSNTLTTNPPSYEAAMARTTNQQKATAPNPTQNETGEAMMSPRLRRELPPLQLAPSARAALTLIDAMLCDDTTLELIATFLRTMRIHDIKDIIHVGQQSYSRILRNILGSHNFEVLSNIIIDIRILANYCLSSE